MAEENKALSVENTEVENTEEKLTKAEKKAKAKTAEKKPNGFVRFMKKIAKFFKDLPGEMKKVSWTPKTELKKSTWLVLVTLVAVAIVIGLVDALFAFVINFVAGLIG